MNKKMAMGLFLTSGLIPLVAYSEIYLSEDAAVKALYPSQKMAKRTISLTADEIKKIEELSDEKVRNSSATLWVGDDKNVVFIDQVLGKHEFITVAVGVTGEKKVKGIEIMEYRETYGQQVRGADWRKQFVGKDVSSPLKLGKDIVNISGATLSSSHVTAGVRRLLQTYEIISKRL